jgi:hypothetical protein
LHFGGEYPGGSYQQRMDKAGAVSCQNGDVIVSITVKIARL